MSNTLLTDAARNVVQIKSELDDHLQRSKAYEVSLRAALSRNEEILRLCCEGIDAEKIALAKTVVFVRGKYARAGEDRASVIHDAIAQLATGEPARAFCGDMWHVAFGTKSYDRWHGQRCDCEYFSGPRHGSLIFQVGLREDVRKNRTQSDLRANEIEAVIYYLTNLERVQAAEDAALAKAEGAQ